MKLSEAIRLGAMVSAQGFGGLSTGGRCALGAAADAIGIEDWVNGALDYWQLRQQWPVLNASACCPECFDGEMALSVVWHLNDQHRWTRERIADWVETLEQRSESSVPVGAVARVVDRVTG